VDIGDVDEDGDLDLFAANASPNELWLNGKSQGLTTVYLPIILKSRAGGPGGQVALTIKSDNTGTISLVEIKDPDNGNAVVLSCSNIGNNTTVVCGQFDPIINYQIVAHTAKCGTLQGTFNDATGGPISRHVWCD
jgi:hypothetical protein